MKINIPANTKTVILNIVSNEMIELNGGELDTLYQLALNGPLESGDMPSKSGFILLVEKGLAYRDLETYLGHITDIGLDYFKQYKWNKGPWREILKGGDMIKLRKSVNDAKVKLGLSNSELSKLIGHSRNYLSECLRVGISTEKQKEIQAKIEKAVEVELIRRGMAGSKCQIVPVSDMVSKAYHEQEIAEQTQNVRMLNMEVEQLKQAKNMIYSDLAIANRDKNFMKKKLQDKNLLINWLVASNVFFILFLVAKCVGWV